MEPRAVIGEIGEPLGEKLACRVLERPRTRVAAVVRDVLDHVEHDGVDLSDDEPVLAAESRDGGPGDLGASHLLDELGVEREGPDAGEEVGRDARRAQVLDAGALHGPTILERCAVEHLRQVLARDARCQGDDGMLRIDRAARGRRQASRVEEPEQKVEDVVVCLVDLVDEQDAPRFRERGDQGRRLGVAGVARRGADQARDLNRVGEFRAVDPEHVCGGRTERVQGARESLDRRRLPDAGRTDEDHGAGASRMPLGQLRDRSARDSLERRRLAADRPLELQRQRFGRECPPGTQTGPNRVVERRSGIASLRLFTSLAGGRRGCGCGARPEIRDEVRCRLVRLERMLVGGPRAARTRRRDRLVRLDPEGFGKETRAEVAEIPR